jgi:quercetin dioxygenase-like cupin family protein
MVFVLEGSVVMQVRGQDPITLVSGETFYEGPDDVHLVARNASQSAPAKFLVFFVKDKGTAIKIPTK